jgi:ABC-type antimicrobial peptide transport system permease subunit
MLAAAFGGLGTLLAAIGLYGVVAFSVARRTREIGVRMALGAQPGQVLSMVMRQGLSIVMVGLVAGTLLAAIAASALRQILYDVSPFDPAAWGLALAAMLVTAAIANVVPARRAMRIDPMAALRTE